jgi:hypothetical protein
MKIQIALVALWLAATAGNGAPAEPPKPKEVVIGGVSGFKDTPIVPNTTWHVHDPERPQPAVVKPGTSIAQEQPGKPPADAIILFDGTDLSQWRNKDGEPPVWKIEGGGMIASKGDIFTRQEFGDVQLHLEFATPKPGKGSGQSRGNSGVFLMGRYEVQILDCHENLTYADGTIGALYGQHPPLVNASRPPGEWQAYDILFTAPRFETDGKLKSPAYVTVLLNGVLVQNHQSFMGPTNWRILANYNTPHPATGPISLQDHDNPTRFRNIWVRPLKSGDAQ